MITLLIMTNVTYAATPSFSIELVADKTTVNRGEEVTVTLRVKDFANMSEGIYALFAQIEYDKNYFEELTASNISGKGTWSSAPTFNTSNNQLTADSGTGVKTNSEVFSIKLKVKSTATEGATTTVKVKNFQGSEGEEDLKANQDAAINIKIGTNSTTNNNGGTNNNNGSGNNNGGTNNSNGSSNNNSSMNKNNSSNSNSSSKDKSQATTKLPQTGEEKYIIISIISVIGISIFTYMKYRKYKGI